MRRSVIASAATVCLAFAASHASAETVRMSGFTFGSAQTLTVGSPNYTGSAGEFSGTLNGKSFMTFCTDLSQSFNFNTTYTDYSIVSGVTAWGAQKSLDLDRAFSAFAANSFPSDAVSSAVAQAVVWEIIYEAPGAAYSFNSGAFHASSGDHATQSELNLVNTLFSSLSSQAITVHANKLFSPNEQDFVVLTPVPEPSTYALMFGGLVGIGFFARRRTPRN